MSQDRAHDIERRRAHARSFGSVADAYDRSRPTYPAEAVAWLVGTGPLSVIELGAGTGKLTRMLVDAGHDVLAVDPSVEMLAHLQHNVPGARTAVAGAEAIPAPSRSADVVVCAQSFHWFDHDRALPEMARVLRPGGHAALVWNYRDETIPWVRKLGRIIGSEPSLEPEVKPFEETPHFGWVERTRHRNWSDHTLDSLLDLVRSRSYVAVLEDAEREALLDQVRRLYDEYGRGPDGMRLPYLTESFRAVVRHQEPAAPEGGPAEADGSADGSADGNAGGGAAGRSERRSEPDEPPEDPGTTLIDFR